MEAARFCPEHRLALDELDDGRRLRCPRSRHPVTAWLVVDLETGELLGAGRLTKHPGRRAGVWLGPRLCPGADLLLDRGNRRLAHAIPAHPAAA